MNLDVFQMQQCENQGRLFESLDRRPIDAKAFIKAFMNSRAAAGLDSTFDHFQWAGIEYIYEDVVEEFNLQPDPNPPRYNTEALWYGGYITRYWHYLTGETMKEIYAQCDENLLLQCYGFHSEANEMAIEDIKAIAGKSKRLAMSEKEQNDLFYVCSLIEHVGRKTKNRRGDVVAAMDDACLKHHLEYADINHCLPFERVSDELIAECGIKDGTFDTITGCKYSIPTETSIGRVYSTLIGQNDDGDICKTLRSVFGSFISDEISDFANGVYYQNPSYLLESYKAGRLLK